MFVDTHVNPSITRETRACAVDRARTLLRAAWRQFHDPAILGLGMILSTLAVLIALMCVAGCGGGTPPPPVTGSISLAWSITDLNRQPATCAQVGARSVALRLRARTSGNVVATAFPCASSPGTAQIAAGLYDISFQLNAADGARLATAPDQIGVAIVAGQVKQLTPITFTTSDQGSLVLSIATGTTANCQPPTAGGAGITANTITLQFAAGGCAPVTFIRQRGSEQRGIYTVNCSSPQIAPCIEKNETLIASLLPETYIVRVRGKVGATDCWQRDDTLEVPAPGKPLTRTLGLLHVNNPGC